MITCTSCHAENDEFAIVCKSCKSYIQNRIPNLDFFDTVWKVIESPRKAFHDVTLAEHKNYSLLLFSLFGIALSFTGFWLFALGARFESLLALLAEAASIGVALGFVCAILFTFFYEVTMRFVGGKGTARSSLGILAYATTPVVLSLVLILPVKLLTFGMFLFTSNPNPYTIKPELYVTLIAVDCLMGLWSLILAVIGSTVGKQLSVGRSFVSVFASTAVSLGVLFLIARELIRYV
jgi:hypothetical protein